MTRVDFSLFASGQSQVPKISSWLASRRRCLVAGESRHSLTGPPSCTCRWQIIKEQDALTIRHVSVKIVETMIKVFLFQPQHCVSGCPPQLCRLSGDLSQRRNGRWPYSWTTELCKLHSSKGKISQCRRFNHETSTCIYLSLWFLPGMDGEGFFHGRGGARPKIYWAGRRMGLNMRGWAHTVYVSWLKSCAVKIWDCHLYFARHCPAALTIFAKSVSLGGAERPSLTVTT